MLIENKPTTNDVVCIKLSNGDELIAKIADQNPQTLFVTKPMLMILSQDPRTGQPGVQMAPFWIMGADSSVKFPIAQNHVVCMVKANADATKNYISQTSGIAIPSSGLIV
jgi:FAD/FMN-containing dehydrogenase